MRAPNVASKAKGRPLEGRRYSARIVISVFRPFRQPEESRGDRVDSFRPVPLRILRRIAQGRFLNWFSFRSSSESYPQSPVTCRERKSVGLCPLFSRAASAPGVATSCPRLNSGFRSVFCTETPEADGLGAGFAQEGQVRKRMNCPGRCTRSTAGPTGACRAAPLHS